MWPYIHSDLLQQLQCIDFCIAPSHVYDIYIYIYCDMHFVVKVIFAHFYHFTLTISQFKADYSGTDGPLRYQF